ncbi:hypothetical protein AAFF_G00122740 [Aldrovandia affinis]|uniref:Uncharacterized protein n=1 Tax=Aldrovandia affinis TaxID=143900 RepID=A0AAD7R0U3_9TELE|nr:hypothetical protein AAFF_G00122740 [Aldrovandia affinis]
MFPDGMEQHRGRGQEAVSYKTSRLRWMRWKCSGARAVSDIGNLIQPAAGRAGPWGNRDVKQVVAFQHVKKKARVASVVLSME